MKRIVAIVRPEKLEPLKEALFEASISGMTISQVNGCGNQHGWKEYFRGSEVLLNMVPKVKFEIIVEDSRSEESLRLFARKLVQVKLAMAKSSSLLLRVL